MIRLFSGGYMWCSSVCARQQSRLQRSIVCQFGTDKTPHNNLSFFLLIYAQGVWFTAFSFLTDLSESQTYIEGSWPLKIVLSFRQGRVFARLLVQGFNNSHDQRLAVDFAGRYSNKNFLVKTLNETLSKHCFVFDSNSNIVTDQLFTIINNVCMHRIR